MVATALIRTFDENVHFLQLSVLSEFGHEPLLFPLCFGMTRMT
jgi:hypothetical protein